MDATTQPADRQLFTRLRVDTTSADRERAVRRHLPSPAASPTAAVARHTVPLDGPWSTHGKGPHEQRAGRDDDGYARAEDRLLLVSRCSAL